MEGNDTRPRRGKIRHDTVDRFHHQVHVNRCGDAVITQRLEYHRADSQIGNVVIIHNVEMDDIRASLAYAAASIGDTIVIAA